MKKSTKVILISAGCAVAGVALVALAIKAAADDGLHGGAETVSGISNIGLGSLALGLAVVTAGPAAIGISGGAVANTVCPAD